jgi:vanillate O-demethylase monooxygenase subunit
MSVTSTIGCPAYQGYPRNQWYVIAFSHEISQTPLQRRIAGDLVVMFRTTDGEIVALADRCPHRGMPLSKGTVVGNAIQCGYHGFQYGKMGQCVKIPSQTAIPKLLSVRRYSVVEKWQWLWIWPGDPAKADPSLIPNHDKLGLGAEGWYATPACIVPMDANYEMLHENLLDTTHITFLHKGMFDSGGTASVEPRIEYDGNVIRISREFDEVPTPSSAQVFKLREGTLYRRKLITEEYAPNLSVITNVFTDTEGKDKPHIQIANIGVTPAGPKQCYQILAVATNYPDNWTPERIEHLRSVVLQDRDALGAIQGIYEEVGPDAPEISVQADQAALRFRRLISEMVKSEASA